MNRPMKTLDRSPSLYVTPPTKAHENPPRKGFFTVPLHTKVETDEGEEERAGKQDPYACLFVDCRFLALSSIWNSARSFLPVLLYIANN
jgi:hypothetical protein